MRENWLGCLGLTQEPSRLKPAMNLTEQFVAANMDKPNAPWRKVLLTDNKDLAIWPQ